MHATTNSEPASAATPTRPPAARRRRRRGRRLAAGITALVLLVLAAPAALGAPSVSVTPNPIPLQNGKTSYDTTVTWNGFVPNSRLFVTQCRKPQDTTMNYGRDCSVLSEIPVNFGKNPTGSGSLAFKVFAGPDPSGDTGWGCWAPDQTPTGASWFNPSDKACYIRVVSDTEANTQDAASARLTFSSGSSGGDATVLIVGIVVAVVAAAAIGLTLRTRTRTRAADQS